MDPKTLQTEPRHKHAGPSPQLLHNFRLHYEAQGQQCILVPGQLLPVWDLERWYSLYRFTAEAYTALTVGGLIITSPSSENVETTMLREAMDQQYEADDLDELATRRLLQTTLLGNIGGRRTARPDKLPIGVVPMEARRCFAEVTHSFERLSVYDWGLRTHGLTVHTTGYGRPTFFVRGQGEHEGWDLESQSRINVREVPLPFLWSSAPEAELVENADDTLLLHERETALAMSMSHHLRQITARENWRGTVYVGFQLPLVHQDTEVAEGIVSLDTYEANRLEMESVYALPYVRGCPMAALDQGGREDARALKTGRLRTSFPISVSRKTLRASEQLAATMR